MSRLHLASAVQAIATRYPDWPAVIGDEEVISYRELWHRAGRIAAGVACAGIMPGQHVLLIFRNDPKFIDAYLGCSIAGVVPVCAYPDYGWRLLMSAAERTQAPIILSDGTARTAEVILEFGRQSGKPLQWITLSSGPVPQGATPLDQWIGLAGCPADPTHDPSSIVVTLCSSGTTGLPKLIPRSHERFLMASQRFGELWNCRPGVRFGVASLITHAAALGWGVHPVLMQGGTLVIPRDRRPAALLNSFHAAQVEVSFMVPSHARAVLEEMEKLDFPARPFLRQIILGGEFLSPDLAVRLQGVVAATVQNTYGMSEGVCTATEIDGLDEILRSSIGRPCLSEDQIRVVGPEGYEVKQGEPGELWVKSPAFMEGYIGIPARESFTTEGFFPTGDLVCQLGGGSLSFVGRTKNIINRCGLKLYPELMENILMAHSQVTAAAVVGVPDLRLGERVCAAITTDGLQALSLTEINRYLATNGNGRVLQLDQMQLCPYLPAAASGKVDRLAVASLFREYSGSIRAGIAFQNSNEGGTTSE